MEAFALWLVVPLFAVLDWIVNTRPGRLWARILLAVVEAPLYGWVVIARLDVVGYWWLASWLVIGVIGTFQPQIERAFARLRNSRADDASGR